MIRNYDDFLLQATEISTEIKEEVDSGVKSAGVTEVQSEMVIAKAKQPETQQVVSQVQAEAVQGKGRKESILRMLLYAQQMLDMITFLILFLPEVIKLSLI